MNRSIWFASILTLVVLVSGTRTSAQDVPTPSRDELARIAYQEGADAYASGHYEAALESFRRAHALSGRQALLYNIGQAADRLRRDGEAIEAFEAYLAAGPDEDVREQVQERVAILRRVMDEQAVTPERSAPADAHPTPLPSREPTRIVASETAAPSRPDAPTRVDSAGVILTVSGAILLIAGVSFLAVAFSLDEQVQNAPLGAAWPDYAERVDSATALSVSGIVAASVGAVLATGGILWLLLAPDDGPQLAVGPHSVQVRGSF